jgi:hypothetical protein
MDNQELTVCDFSQILSQTKYLYALSCATDVANEALILPTRTQFGNREIKKIIVMKSNAYLLEIFEVVSVRWNTGQIIITDKP